MVWLAFQATTFSPRLATDAILATYWWEMRQECVRPTDTGPGRSQCADVRHPSRCILTTKACNNLRHDLSGRTKTELLGSMIVVQYLIDEAKLVW